MWCWGDDKVGEVGTDPTLGAQLVPQLVISASESCSQLALGPTFSCATCQTGVACWGDNSDSNLGRGIAPDAQPWEIGDGGHAVSVPVPIGPRAPH